ncbi:MAG: DUF6695 family protein [Bacteroidales bacterium]
MHDLSFVNNTMLQPAERPANLGSKAQWLSGEGAGSWFEIISHTNKLFEITRFNPKGIPECASFFECLSDEDFYPEKPYSIVHLSHCKEVIVIQNNKRLIFIRKEKIL